MPKVFLMFVAALVALMAGALFYAARIPVQNAPAPAAMIAPPPAIEVVSHPTFSMPDISGTPRDLSEWDGKNRILNFWATWCAPCRREIPLLKTFQDEQQGNGFQVIGIAVDFAEEVARYAESAQFNYPVLVGEQDAMTLAESSGIQFGVLPFTMFIASDGEYVGSFIGELHRKQLDAIVDIMTRLERGELSKDGTREALARL
ncbi:MAG TPA: TlpA disulfide reductase family protein [Woeseiaceae bacterium]|nr:TlpA disulfide reductase family protein [Woeseiaceae bacterium]